MRRLGVILSGLLLLGAAGPILVSGANFSSLSGDLTSTQAGVVTLADPMHIYESTFTLDATTIVGTAAGDLGEAAGVLAVAAVASRVIVPVVAYCDFTFATAAYTGGGNVALFYRTNALQTTGVVGSTASFAVAGDSFMVWHPTAVGGVAATAIVGEPLMLRTSAAFTNPGTAAGTASCKVFYRLFTP